MENINTQGFSFDLPKGNSSIIKVIGVGGGGNNALKHMYEKGIHGVDFVICNTDAQTLDNNPVANKVQLGISTTEGLGAGADPDVGEKAAIESMEEIKSSLGQNTKMVFITAGMGGGTGTGAAPVIAKVAKDMGILTVGIVTVPFSFEGKRRLEQAENGLEKLRANVDSLIVINNDKLRQQFGNLGFKQGFSKADEVLTNAAKGMAEVITGYFDVNIDFRDAKSVLQNSGTALMSNGIASGENKAEEAVRKALDSPLLNDNKITGAKNVLLLIRSGSEEVTMDEIGIIMDHIQAEAGHTADIIFGVGSDEELGDAVSVLVIATGFSKDFEKHSGPTEKIKINLHDSVNLDRTSPFQTRQELETPQTTDKTEKNLFRLEDDEPDNSPQFKAVTVDNLRIEESRTETPTLEIQEEPAKEWNNDDAPQSFDLFSYDEFDNNDLEAESFSFETENNEPKANFSQQKNEEISFTINEPTEEPIFEVKEEPKAEIIEEPIQRNIENIFEPIASAPVEIQTPEPVQEPIFESLQPETVVEQESTAEVQKEEAPLSSSETSGFTFVNKSVDSDKVAERRNKLKEFNSRYQNFDEMSDFEKVPAFKRKNILIEGDNASEQNINTFLADNNGNMQIRENRFLNKDVD